MIPLRFTSKTDSVEGMIDCKCICCAKKVVEGDSDRDWWSLDYPKEDGKDYSDNQLKQLAESLGKVASLKFGVSVGKITGKTLEEDVVVDLLLCSSCLEEVELGLKRLNGKYEIHRH